MADMTQDLFARSDKETSSKHIYSVSEITQDIKLILEASFHEVCVEGEVSGFTKTPKGIMFFSLKDNASLLKCVVFNSHAGPLKFEIKDGMKLICFGRISVYEKDGRYQLYVRQIEPKGIGSLQLALEQLKQKLEKEGLFATTHKRPIPYLPYKIGLVTSLSGAAIKDILKVLDRRFSDTHIIVRQAQVQGEGAKEEIAEAINDFNRFNESLPVKERIEVMIVGRGGGSIEDLWAFNEEVVVRAIYNSKIPVISAVGHERDWTISDLVADVRAPTPSVAAELVIPKKEDLKMRVDELAEDLNRSYLDMASGFQEAIEDLIYRLNLGIENTLKLNTGRFDGLHKKLVLLNPVVLIQQYNLKVVDLARQIYVRMQHLFKLKQSGFNGLIEKLSSLSPLNILSRGYSITFKMPQDAIIKDVKFVQAGDLIKTKLHKGEVLSKITEVNNNA